MGTPIQRPPEYISPRHTLDDWARSPTLNTMIDIFEARVVDWQLAVAEGLAVSDPAAGFAVLSIVMSYFEMIVQHRDGVSSVGGTRSAFRDGIAWVFPELSRFGSDTAIKSADAVYNQVRNGLYHDGATRPMVAVSLDFAMPIDLWLREKIERPLGSQVAVTVPSPADEVVAVYINPRQFVSRLRLHFTRYIAQLRDPENFDLRSNFERRFSR